MLAPVEREIAEQLGGPQGLALDVELDPELALDVAARSDQHELGPGAVEGRGIQGPIQNGLAHAASPSACSIRT